MNTLPTIRPDTQQLLREARLLHHDRPNQQTKPKQRIRCYTLGEADITNMKCKPLQVINKSNQPVVIEQLKQRDSCRIDDLDRLLPKLCKRRSTNTKLPILQLYHCPKHRVDTDWVKY